MSRLPRSSSTPDLILPELSGPEPNEVADVGQAPQRANGRRPSQVGLRRARPPTALRRHARASSRLAAVAASADAELAQAGGARRRNESFLLNVLRSRFRANPVPPTAEAIWMGSGSGTSDAADGGDESPSALCSDEHLRAGARRRHKLKCIEFDMEGGFRERYLTRQQIIDEAVEAAGPLGVFKSEKYANSPLPPTPGVPMSPAFDDSTFERFLDRRSRLARSRGLERALPRGGRQLTNTRRTRSRRSQQGNALTMRDIRQVDPAFTAKAALWVRQNALVVSLESVRAIVLHNKMYLFDPDNPDVQRPIRYIEQRLADSVRNVDEMFVPFELRALEGILINCCVHLERAFATIEPLLLAVLRQLPSHINAEHLEELRSHEQKLNHFYARSRKVKHVLQSLLDEDEDMAGMYLTEKRKAPDIARNPLDHDEAEMLLESYLQVVDDLTNKSELLNRAIDDTENLIEIHLDTMQNQLLLVNLLISVISTIFVVAMLVSSIFGMNLRLPDAMSQLPSSKFYFLGCSIALFLAIPLGLGVVMRWSQTQGLYSRRSFRRTQERVERPSVATIARERVDRILHRRPRSARIAPLQNMSSSSEHLISRPENIDTHMD